MMVSPVSFRATSASNFQDMLKKPQTYTSHPVASTNIEGESKKKGKAGKVVLGLALTAAAVGGGMVAVGKYSDKITSFIEKSIKNEKVAEFAKTATDKMAQWGNTISAKATQAVAFVKTKGSELISKINSQNIAEEAAEIAEDVVAG